MLIKAGGSKAQQIYKEMNENLYAIIDRYLQIT